MIVVLFAALSVYWTWPLAEHLDSLIPHDPGDPLLNTWILWWNTQVAPLTERWWSPPVLVPMKGALALSEHLLGISLFATPLQAGGARPLVAYNAMLLLSYVLSGCFAYLLAFWLTRSRAAGLVAGVAFAFAPYRAGQLSHLQVLTSQWMPLVLLGLHGYVSSGRKTWLVLFGAAWLVQALSNGYYLLFLPVLIGLWMIWFVHWRLAWARGSEILAAWMAASVALVPILVRYRLVHDALDLNRGPDEVRRFSASLGSFAQPAPLLAIWPAGDAPTQEHYLFPGVTAIALVLVALGTLVWTRQLRAAVTLRSPLLFYTGATLVMWTLALGPGPENAGVIGLLHPYRWIWWLPGFDSLRVPARFAMLAALCLAVAAALAFAQLRPLLQRWRPALGALALAGTALDGTIERVPLVASPAHALLPGTSVAAVIELPPDDPRVSAAAMYRSIFHGRPLINGYTGHTPAHYEVLSLALRRGDASLLAHLAEEGPLAVIVHPESDPDGRYRQMVESLPGVQPHGATEAGATYSLPAQPHVAVRTAGPPIPAEVLTVGPGRFVWDLGAVREVAAIEIAIGRRFAEIDARLLVEVSNDGTEWRKSWEGWTGALMLDAALSDPRKLPMRVPLPDVRARYLRITPVGVPPDPGLSPEWMSGATRVLGPAR